MNFNIKGPLIDALARNK